MWKDVSRWMNGGGYVHIMYSGLNVLIWVYSTNNKFKEMHPYNFFWPFTSDPQVFVKLYQRGGESWLGHSTSGSVNIPYNAEITFRVAGEQADAKIPANDIENMVLSIWDATLSVRKSGKKKKRHTGTVFNEK